MKNRGIYWRRNKIQETLYTGQWCLSPLQSRHLGTSHSSPNCPQLPHHILFEFHQWSDISYLLKVILVLRKARSHWAPNLGCRCTESSGWFDVLPKNCMRRDAWAGTLSWWSCQSPVAHSCGLLNHPNSFHGRMFKLKAKLDADFFALHTQSFWMWRPHSTRVQSVVSTIPTD